MEKSLFFTSREEIYPYVSHRSCGKYSPHNPRYLPHSLSILHRAVPEEEAGVNAVEVRGLSRSFDGREILRDVSFAVGHGEIFGYLGPNGAGKTTTIRILLGLLAPGAGEVRVLGRDLTADDDARARVGVLFENNGLADRMSAADNLAYYAGLYGVEEPAARIDDLLALVDLADRQDDPVGTFSTGMKRKLGIARAILHRPEVVFLDEPSSGLDPGAQRMVRDLIIELSRREEMTVFLNSHHLDEVQRVCSTVAILAGGRIRAFDSVTNLTAASGRPAVTVALADPGERARACETVEGLPFVTGCEPDGDALHCTLADPGATPDLVATLVGANFRIEEVRRSSRSLEEIYLEHVGRVEDGA
ncbi:MULTISPECIES: ABC transporter ATP-binding protein [unclassified Methanoculleus]|uniref:ABC transporter ATP-binding protein n=1 Tax=unclassified Methanoculleus TaxID=2619537 RepID=UPI0025E016BB|nr:MULTISPECIES: ABC transporter ATP-binding protein [unclassified Methanoculleus]